MENEKVIVIGASTGGFEVIKSIISQLPPDFVTPIFIVWHMSPDIQGIMPHVLNKLNTISASNAVDGETIQSNHIYVAPPDHHMIIEKGVIKVSRGPKENLFRPAIDPLFRSAALAYGNRVTGIILSGALDDGSSGLWHIKTHGGIAVVQDPNDAEASSMPQSAMRAVKVDYCVPAADLPALLTELSKREVTNDKYYPDETAASVPLTNNNENDRGSFITDKKLQGEIDIAGEGNAVKYGADSFGELSPYSCPECHGVLSRIMEDNIIRFRCHTGHAYSANSLLLSLSQKTEDSLYQVIRGMDETIFLLNHMGDHYAEANEPKLAAVYFREAKKTLQQSNIVRDLVHGQELLNRDRLIEEAEQYEDNLRNS